MHYKLKLKEDTEAERIKKLKHNHELATGNQHQEYD
jgi:hypothetical protein